MYKCSMLQLLFVTFILFLQHATTFPHNLREVEEGQHIASHSGLAMQNSHLQLQVSLRNSYLRQEMNTPTVSSRITIHENQCLKGNTIYPICKTTAKIGSELLTFFVQSDRLLCQARACEYNLVCTRWNPVSGAVEALSQVKTNDHDRKSYIRFPWTAKLFIDAKY